MRVPDADGGGGKSAPKYSQAEGLQGVAGGAGEGPSHKARNNPPLRDQAVDHMGPSP